MKNINGQNTAEFLQELIKKSGMTQTKFAEVVGIEQPNIAKALAGKWLMTIDKMNDIASHFGYRITLTHKK